MPPQQKIPPVGADVTALMGGQQATPAAPPAIGADVSGLMGAAPPAPPPPQAEGAVPYSGIARFGLGAAKAAGNTVANVIDIVNYLASYSPFAAREPLPPAVRPSPPQGFAENLGSLTTDVTASLLPLGAITRTAKTVGGALPGLLNPLSRAVIEGAGTAGVATVQGSDPKLAGAIGAAGPLISGVGQLRASRLTKAAQEQMVEAMGPAGKSGPTKRADLLTAKAKAPELLERGFSGATQDSALSKARAALDNASENLDAATDAVSARRVIATAPVISQLEAMQQQLVRRGAGGATTVIKDTDHALYGELVKRIKALGPYVKFDEWRKVRQELDEMVNWDGVTTATERATSKVYRSAADLVRASLAKDQPAVAAANREFSFWKGVTDVLERSAERPGSTAPPWRQGLGAVTGATLGSMTTGGASGALGGFWMGRKVVEVMRSPGWRYASANLKHQLAKALDSGNPEVIGPALGAITAEIAARAGGRE